MENKLSVRDLRVSFRTTNGKVQAVRGISFDLAKGETLAIVGESGSGKSVTSKAILGIQAANAITESGEIIYDGKDLLKISEEDFHKIRGDKISMIFQDPMSSLNPIVKIGKQLTEAMILKGKARQKESRANFNTYLKNLDKRTGEALGDEAKKAKFSKQCKDFDTFEFRHVKLEGEFNRAKEAAVEGSEDIELLAFELEKNAAKDVTFRVNTICSRAKASLHEYVVAHDKAEELMSLAESVKKAAPAAAKGGDTAAITADLNKMKAIFDDAIAKPAPDFFRMGYYIVFSGKSLPNMPVPQMNEELLRYLDDNFMKEFISSAEKGIHRSADVSYEKMERAIAVLKEKRSVFERESLDKKEAYAAHKAMTSAVEATIDHLKLVKDSFSYTFGPSVKSELERYFGAISKNAEAIRRHDKQQHKYDRLVEKGKTPDWKVAEASITDMELVKANIIHIIDRLAEHYAELLAERKNRDYAAETIAAIDYLKENATGVAAKVTKRIAKDRAIKLMDEVGIAEPRKRYNQYTFEFSGGMRQRIVIAIALAANPDILICDEPTTALDVTIQAQILELINKLKKERDLSIIFITHDLGVVANMADRVAVMYSGKIVEYGTAEEIFYDPRHPYTWALLSSMPDLDTKEKLESIPGTPPNMIYPPKGDAFAARNKYAMQIDFEAQPPLFRVTDTHYAATWLLHPDAPKIERPKIISDRIERMKEKRGESK